MDFLNKNNFMLFYIILRYYLSPIYSSFQNKISKDAIVSETISFFED